MSADLTQLLGRTLVLVAHPDDEAAGCGVLLQRMREPLVLFCTDGAPRDEYFWKRHGSRAQYAALRRKEAIAALAHAGVARAEFLESPPGGELFIDQELFRCLSAAAPRVASVMDRVRPEAILTLAFEGGHPDHDACALLASVLGHERGLPTWEFPLYHRDGAGQPVAQRFLASSGTEYQLQPLPGEIEKKRRMFGAYVSQGDVLGSFSIEKEIFRPMAQYDFTRPPHEGLTNYEMWRWRMSAQQVATAFAEWLASK